MTLAPNYAQLNRASTDRIRMLAAQLSDEALLTPVGEHWTVAIALVHLAFWDRRVQEILDRTEREGSPSIPPMDLSVNDLSLPLWEAIPPRVAAKLALEAAESLDARLESFPRALLEEISALNKRFVLRSLHRNEHLDEVDAALAG